MLAGPKVSRLLPFLQQHGFVGDAFAGGKQALEHLRRSPCHVLCIELELGDMMGVDLARTGKQEGIVGASLLLEDPMKSGMVIAALARGLDAFVSVPPDETILFERLEALLLAQWGLVVTGQQQQLNDELTRVRAELESATEQQQQAVTRLAERNKSSSRELADERKKVQELVLEIASVRDQLATMHLLTGAKSGRSDEGAATISPEAGLDADDAGDFENETTQAIPAALARDMQPQARSIQAAKKSSPPPPQQKPSIDDFDFENEQTPAAGAAPEIPAEARFANNDDDTAPGGHQVPSQLSAQQKARPKKKGASTANLNIEMLKDLAGIPSAGEDEVIFVDDD